MKTKEQLEKLLTKIAQKHLGIQTLESQGRDRLDFHDVGVARLKEALKAAFKAGVEVGFMYANALEKK